MKQKLLVGFFFFLVLGIFFWPVFLKGWLPFPGDLLVGKYAPWQSYSFLGYAPGGVPHKAQGIDAVRMMYPWKSFSLDIIKSGQFPFWNPYNFSGNPHLANFQTAIFYPLNIVFFLFPFKFAWTVFIILQPFLAIIFTYLFLREIKVSRFGSILSGLVFAFSLYFTVWLQWANIGHAILWLPLVLFLVEKRTKKFKVSWFLLLVFSLTCSIFAGYAQVTIYLLATGLVYSFFRSKSKFFLLAAFFALGLAAAQILPTGEIFQQSARGAYSIEKIRELLMPWFHLITAFVPDFFGNPASRNYWLSGTYIERVTYIGVLPMFLALVAIVFRRKEKIIYFFIALLIAVLLLTLNLFPAHLFYSLKIPLISTTVPTRLLFVFAFSLAVLAAFGFDFLYQQSRAKKVMRLSFLFAGFYLFLWLFVFLAPKLFTQSSWVSYLNITRRNLILPTIFAFTGMVLVSLITVWPKRKQLFLLGIGLVTIFDLYFYFQKITPFSPPEFIYPETTVMKFLQEKAGVDRFWGYGSGAIDTNFATYTKTFSTDGYDPLFSRRYGELISASEDGKIKDPIPRSDVNLVSGYGKEDLRQNPYRQRLLNLLGVKYVLAKGAEDGTFPEAVYEPVWQEGAWQIYLNKQVLPRIFLVGDYQVEEDRQKMVDLLLNPDFDLRKKLILEESLSEGFMIGSEADGSVELLDYQSNQVKIRTETNGGSLLFLSDNFFPGWQATVNNQPAKIYRANYTFRAVPVPAGEHEIIFQYQPKSFIWGWRISLVSFIIIVLSLWKREKLKFFYS